jgi:hypothetical protein
MLFTIIEVEYASARLSERRPLIQERRKKARGLELDGPTI